MLDFEIPDPALRRELNSLGQLIGAKETEQNWQSIDKAVAKLTALLAQPHDDEPARRDSLFKFVKAKRTNLVAYLKTERTSFSGTVCKLVETIATTYASAQHSPDELFVEPLISLTSRTNKLFQQRSTAALLAIMASTSPELIVPKLAEAAKNKSGPTRLSTTQCFKKLLEVDQDRPDKLESHTPLIEAALKLLTQDAVQQIRELARTTVSLYMKMFSLRANLFLHTLTPAVRKALGGSSTATAPSPVDRKPMSRRPAIPRPVRPPGTAGTVDVIIHAPPRRPAPTASAPPTAPTSSSTRPPSSFMAPTQASTARRGSAVAVNPAMRTVQSQSRPAASAAAAAPHTPLASIKSGTGTSATPAATPAPHADITLTQFLITVSSSNFSHRFHAFDSAAFNLLPSALPLTPGDVKLIDAHIKHGLTSTHPKPLGAALLNMAVMVERGVVSGAYLAKVVATAAALKHTGEYACRPTIMDPVHRILEGVGAGVSVEDVAHVVGARAEVGAAASMAVKALVAAVAARVVERVGMVEAGKVVAEDEESRNSVVLSLYKMVGDAGNDANVQKVLAQWVWVLEKGEVNDAKVKELVADDVDDLAALIEQVYVLAPADPQPALVATPLRTPAPKLPPTTPGTVFREPGLPASRMLATPSAAVEPYRASTPFSAAAASAKSPALVATPLGIFAPAIPDVASARKRTLTPGTMMSGVTPVRSVKRARAVEGEEDEVGQQSPTANKGNKRAKVEGGDQAVEAEDRMEVDPLPAPIAEPVPETASEAMTEALVETDIDQPVEPVDEQEAEDTDPSMLSPAVVDVTALLATAADLEAAGESGLELVLQAALDDSNYDLALLDRTPLTDLLVYLDKCSDLPADLIASLLHLIHAELSSSSPAADSAANEQEEVPSSATDGQRRTRALLLLQQLLKQMSAAQLPTHIGEFLLGALFSPPPSARLCSRPSWNTAYYEHLLSLESQVFLCTLLPADRVLAVLAAHTQDANAIVYAVLVDLLQRAPDAVVPRLAEWIHTYVLDAVVVERGFQADAAAGFVGWVAGRLGDKGKDVVGQAVRLAQDKRDAEWGTRLVERLAAKGVQVEEGLVFTGMVGVAGVVEQVEEEESVGMADEMDVDEAAAAPEEEPSQAVEKHGFAEEKAAKEGADETVDVALSS